MFGIGGFEFLAILIMGILVIGPKDLPRALYTVGKLARKFKVITADVQKSLEDVMKEGELDEITREVNKPGGENMQFEIEKQIKSEVKSEKNDSTG